MKSVSVTVVGVVNNAEYTSRSSLSGGKRGKGEGEEEVMGGRRKGCPLDLTARECVLAPVGAFTTISSFPSDSHVRQLALQVISEDEPDT